MDNQKSQFSENIVKAFALYQQAAQKYLESLENNDTTSIWADIYKTWLNAATKALENPEELGKKQAELFADYIKIWTNSLARYIGQEEKPIYSPDPRDRRFKDNTWNNDFIFDFLKQSYIFTNKWCHEFIVNLQGIDEKTKNKLDFYTKQFLDAVAPSNFAFTNPEVIKETINSKGRNLLNGMHNLIHDIENSKHFLNISTTNSDAFKIGQNIATTKGKVVYRNDLIELIQYNPVQEKIYKTPLLIIPAWINKYYILDLSPENSFVKWALEQGYNVFMISWANPDSKLANKQFEDYMLEGPIEAINIIEKITGEKEINALGYCLGGTLLSCTLSYLKTKGINSIKTATLLTTMIDFKNAGDLCLFIDEEYLTKLDKQMQKQGFLEGGDMAAIFSVLRANDLIWSFVVNNYLLGREPFPFDILYWNSDTTRLPADTHSFYLHNMYIKNALIKKGGISLNNTPIDISKIDTHLYILSTSEDHIAPWKTTYTTTQIVQSQVKFVLSASGHVAGVVNPPTNKKYYYFINPNITTSPEDWLKYAQKNAGSWWPDWTNWLSNFSGEKITAKESNKANIKPLYEAPGEYIKIR